MAVREFKNRLFTAGAKAGLDEMEIYVSRSQVFNLRVFQTEIDDYSISDVAGIGFRALFKGKVGYAYAETMDDASIDLLVSAAKDNAQVIDSEDEIIFYGGSPGYPEVETFNAELAELAAAERIDFTKKLESVALKADPRVHMVNFAVTGTQDVEIYIANTKGLEQSFRRNGALAGVSAIVREGEQVKTGSKIAFTNDWAKLDGKKQAEEAVEEGLSLLNADTVRSGDYRILLRNDVARNLLSTFSGVFSAEAAQKGLSLLAGRLGGKIAVSELTLIDDPLMPHGAASAPFDAEGFASKTKNVIEEGKLVTFLHNLKTAKKDGVESTGNAARASFKSPVGISPTNFYIEPGEKGFAELVTTLGEGLIIISLQGLHSGANPVSGDFSLGAYGYLVENGEIVRAVDQITVAGNFFQVLESLEEIGSDLEFGIPGYAGNPGSPSLLIKSMAVAGN